MKYFFDLFKKKQGDFLFPYERIVLEETASQCPSSVSAQIRSQIDSFGKAYRYSRGREINLYPPKRKGFDDQLAIAGVPDEFLFSSVYLTDNKAKKILRSDVWLVSGWVFSLKFDCYPDVFFKEVDIKSYCPSIARVKIWYMSDASADAEVANGVEGASKWLKEHDIDAGVTSARPPASEKNISEAASRIGTTLPDEYRALLELSNGFQINGLKVRGTDEIRSVSLEEVDYWVLADCPEDVSIVLRRGDSTGLCGIFNGGDDKAALVELSFAEALRSCLASGPR